MVNNQHNTSHGQKVDLGRNAPISQEAPGKVASESLAAESKREGGAFSENRSENMSSSSQHHSSEAHSHLSTVKDNAPIGTNHYAKETAEYPKRSENTSQSQSQTHSQSHSQSKSQSQTQSSSAGTAPTYVNNQYIRNPGGPHGKNITEGGWDESQAKDGLKAALESEPGSENDPSRLAERQFQQNLSRGGRDAGPKQGSLDSETKFDGLESDIPA
jgi:hypothetical protein